MKPVRRSFVPFAVGIVRFVVRFCVDSNYDVCNATVKGCFNLAFEMMFHAPDVLLQFGLNLDLDLDLDEVSGGGRFAVQGEVRREAWTFA
eukprot:12753989-Ditylum_brightwellii.AAC.1